MSDFFEPPPPPPGPLREHRQPEWFGPPDNVVGVVVPMDLTLARTDELALVLRSVDRVPDGREVRRSRSSSASRSPTRSASCRSTRDASADDDDVLRLGVQYADGGKATNMELPFIRANPEERPPGPVLMPRGGGGGGRHWDVSFWLWPLPKEDPFAARRRVAGTRRSP